MYLLCVPDVFYYYLVGTCYYHVYVYYIVTYIMYFRGSNSPDKQKNSITKIYKNMRGLPVLLGGNLIILC